MLHAKKTVCPIYGTSFLGRRDKKFCSDNCRAISHQAEKQKQAPIIKQINTILKKNRDLLNKLNTTGKITLFEDQLLKKGFDMQYYTHSFTTKTGRTYYFCYDEGYAFLEDGRVLLVRQKQEE